MYTLSVANKITFDKYFLCFGIDEVILLGENIKVHQIRRPTLLFNRDFKSISISLRAGCEISVSRLFIFTI